MSRDLRSQSASTDDHKRLPYLQALRGIAATLVVLNHAYDGLLHYHAKPPAWIASFPSLGYFGVATFFLISGFIIFRVEYHSFNANRAALYLKKRLIRIYPIYWIATLLFIALSPKIHAYGGTKILASFALFPTYLEFTHGMFPLLGQGWTLQYEVAFYLLFFAALFLPRRLGVAFLLTALAAAVGFGSLALPVLSSAPPMTVLQYWTRPIILLFGIGILIGWIERSGTIKIKSRYPLLLVIALVFCYAIALQHLPKSYLQNELGALFAWPFCLACVLACVFAPAMTGRAGKIATRLGDGSYSTYLFHTFILSFLLRVHPLLHWPLLFIFLCVVLSNALGMLIYHFIEIPMLRKLRTGQKTAPTPILTAGAPASVFTAGAPAPVFTAGQVDLAMKPDTRT